MMEISCTVEETKARLGAQMAWWYDVSEVGHVSENAHCVLRQPLFFLKRNKWDTGPTLYSTSEGGAKTTIAIKDESETIYGRNMGKGAHTIKNIQ